MVALRILSLPIGLMVFTALYVIANKAPATVETTNIVVWILLPVALAWKFSRRRR
ncbi:hypothetical protein [Peteryoungia algae]|uniref:Uncharacterized protein n=1 Tax=Peteryoungia algae TaxID=2919917 RepID=A0ABT0CW85_9HYPH|nr:hypothetical protein [Rhizobium sp. SSM4.3]MCJ8237410.1 hypothetical protein [Rhizobium sp. SSM4.3]